MSASILERCYPEQKEAQKGRVPWQQGGSGVETTQTLTDKQAPSWGRLEPVLTTTRQPHNTRRHGRSSANSWGVRVPFLLHCQQWKEGKRPRSGTGNQPPWKRGRKSLQRVWDVCSGAGLAPSSAKGATFAEDHLWLAQYQPPRPGTARHSNRQNLQRCVCRGDVLLHPPCWGTAGKSGVSNDLGLLLHP